MRIPFFRRRRPTMEATRTFGAIAGAATPFVAPPQPRTLIDVIGVGRTESVNGVALTLLSLERYREGDIVTFRLSRKRDRTLGLFPAFDFPSPELVLAVGPSSSPLTPRFSGMHGGGGGGMDEIEYRYAFSFSPGMPSDATDWVIEVSRIEWVRPRRSPERVVASVDTGPWRWTIRP